MKVGTDGVLLGAWCTVAPEFERALDIGTGTGVIAVMLAQRGEAYGLAVDAVEIDGVSFGKACENAGNSDWKDRITVSEGGIQEYKPEVSGIYDLIVSNPPYFNDSLLPPGAARTNARHTTTLTHGELLGNVSRLLTCGGIFAVVLPYRQADNFISMAAGRGLEVTRRTDVFPTPKTPAKRSLIEFRKAAEGTGEYEPVRPGGNMPAAGSLVIENAPLDYTSEYMELTKDFYLKF